MTDDIIDHLKSLHTSAIDARNGYQEALSDAHGLGMTPVFQNMITLHMTNAGELAAILSAAGHNADETGSFMSTVHRAIMDIRSLFGGLDASVLAGLIDGETRNVSLYDTTLAEPKLPTDVRPVLIAQKARISAAILEMERLKK